MSKKTNPFSSKNVQILGKNYTSKSPVKWNGTFIVIADSTTRLSNKSDLLNFSVGAASSSETPRDNKGLLLAGESQPVVGNATLDLGKGDDTIIAKAKGGVPLGSTGGYIHLRYNGTRLNLGDGDDLIDTDIIRLRDGKIFGGNGNDKILASQDIEVEYWDTTPTSAIGAIDMGSGDDLIEAAVLQVAGKVLMGDGKDVITGLIDNNRTQFNRNPQGIPQVDMGPGDDLIKLRYADSTLNTGDEGMRVDAYPIGIYIDINGGDGFDRILISGGVYESVDFNGIELMKYSANGYNFFYKLTSIEEVSYV